MANLSRSMVDALQWMREHGGDAAVVRAKGGGRYILAQGETGPFLPITCKRLIDAGLAEYVDIAGKKSVRFRLKELNDDTTRIPLTDTNAIDRLLAFAAKRPGFDVRHYVRDVRGGRDASGLCYYRADVRKAGQQLQDARTMADAIRSRLIGASDLIDASKRVYDGRLTLTTGLIDYRAARYWPVEYRAAVCAVMAMALRTYWRGWANPTPQYVRETARDKLGRGVAARWFN